MAEKVTIGNCELWHGDCREILPALRDADCVITDPPYNIGAAEWDNELPLWALPLIADALKDVALATGLGWRRMCGGLVLMVRSIFIEN